MIDKEMNKDEKLLVLFVWLACSCHDLRLADPPSPGALDYLSVANLDSL